MNIFGYFFQDSFNALLCFLGIRAVERTVSYNKPHCEDFLYRNVYKQKPEEEEFQEYQQQPRVIVRHILGNISPPASPRDGAKHGPHDFSNFDPDTIRFNIEQQEEQNRQRSTKNVVSLIISWSYTSLIYALLCVPALFIIEDMIRNFSTNSFEYRRRSLSALCLHTIYVVQYFASIRYFATAHFDTHVREIMQPNVISKHTLGICLAASFLAINNLVVYTFVGLPHAFPSFPQQRDNLFILMYLIPYNFISNLILCTNVYTFVSVFYIRYKQFRQFLKSVQKESSSLTITKILEDTLKQAYLMQNTVQLLENMYTSLLLLGFFAFTLEVPVINIKTFPWSLYLSYLIIMTMFTIILIRIESVKSNLILLTRSQPFVKKFLRRYTPDELYARFQYKIDFIQLNIDEENANTLDWFVLNDILNDQWIDFKIMGVNVNDLDLIKRIILLYFMFFTVNSSL